MYYLYLFYINMQNCVGAVDSTYGPIFCPDQATQAFIDHKGYFSVVLQVVINHQGHFTYIFTYIPGGPNFIIGKVLIPPFIIRNPT